MCYAALREGVRLPVTSSEDGFVSIVPSKPITFYRSGDYPKLIVSSLLSNSFHSLYSCFNRSNPS